jgi:hypothetical protein
MSTSTRGPDAARRAWAIGLAAAALLGTPRQAAADPQACIAANERGNELRWRSKLLAARTELLACAADECPQVVREECAQLVRRVEAEIPTVIFAVTDALGRDTAGVAVTVDGLPIAGAVVGGPRAFDPGRYHLRVEAPGLGARELDLEVRAGEKNRVVRVALGAPPSAAAPPPAPSPVDGGGRPVPPAVWVLGGVSLVGLGAFTVFALRGKDTEGCAPGCTRDQVDSLRRDYLIGDISLGVAAVSLGVATVLFLTRPTVPPARLGAATAPLAGSW